MPSCLPAKIIVAKLNVTNIFTGPNGPGRRVGRPDGRAGPCSRRADRPVHMYCRSTAGAWAGQGQDHADAKMVDDWHCP